MTIAGLPGIPGGSALVPALDMFTAECLKDFRHAASENETPQEVCGIFLYRHHEPVYDGHGGMEWIGEIDWIRLPNTAPDPTTAFQVDHRKVTDLIAQELDSFAAMCHTLGREKGAPSSALLFAAGYSPFVGVGHSHPGGTTEVSAADHSMSEAATAWRRATAPGAILAKDENEAKFFEADFLFAVENAAGDGTLVHFKRGSTRGTWKGNFLG